MGKTPSQHPLSFSLQPGTRGRMSHVQWLQRFRGQPRVPGPAREQKEDKQQRLGDRTPTGRQVPAPRSWPEAGSASPHTQPGVRTARAAGHHTHPLGDGAAAGALPLLPRVDDLLDPDGFPLLSVPAEGGGSTQLRGAKGERLQRGGELRGCPLLRGPRRRESKCPC